MLPNYDAWKRKIRPFKKHIQAGWSVEVSRVRAGLSVAALREMRARDPELDQQIKQHIFTLKEARKVKS